MNCIYCRQDSGPFSREHVIPQSFGTFGTRTPVIQSVCLECNNYFSKALDLPLARASLEGLQRWHAELKPLSDAAHFDDRRLQITIKGGEYDGLRIDPISKNPGAQIHLPLKSSSAHEAITLDELKELAHLDKEKYDLSSSADIRMFFFEDSHREEFKRHFKRLGVPIEEGKSLGSWPMPAGTKLSGVVNLTLDHVISRAISKIALNYLCHICGEDFAMRPDFDIVRRFARYGDLPPFSSVYLIGKPTSLAPMASDRVSGHFLTLGLSDGGSIIRSHVSLFCGMTYRVYLAKFFSGQFFPNAMVGVGSGHYYDFKNKQVLALPSGHLQYWNA